MVSMRSEKPICTPPHLCFPRLPLKWFQCSSVWRWPPLVLSRKIVSHLLLTGILWNTFNSIMGIQYSCERFQSPSWGQPAAAELLYPAPSSPIWCPACYILRTDTSLLHARLFGVSQIHQTQSLTTGPLTSVCDLSECIHMGTVAQILIQRTSAQSAENLTPEKSLQNLVGNSLLVTYFFFFFT